MTNQERPMDGAGRAQRAAGIMAEVILLFEDLKAKGIVDRFELTVDDSVEMAVVEVYPLKPWPEVEGCDADVGEG